MEMQLATSISDSRVKSARPFHLSTRSSLLILLFLSALIYIGNAWSPALLDDVDSGHALVSREMLQRHDYVVMYMNGIRYLEKAPLHYWMVAAAYQIFGQSEFSTRLPVALSMIGLVLLVFEFGRYFFNLRVGFYAGLITATSFGFFLFTRIMIPEAIYALQFTAAFYLFLRSWTGTLDTRVGYWGTSAVMALAVLTRGLIGFLFPLGGIVLFIIATRGWSRWRELRIFSSTIIFLAIAVPWHVIAELRAPGFFWSYVINEHFKRALGTRYPADYDAVPLVLWWVAHLAWFFPWSIFLPFALREFPSPRKWTRLNNSDQARLLFFAWAAVILVFFSVLGGSRMEYYSFGAWPAIALLLALGLARAEAAQTPWVTRLQAALAVVGCLVAGTLLILVYRSAAVHTDGDISDFLKPHSADFYRLSLGHFFDLTPRAFADLRFPALAAAITLLACTVGAWLLRKRCAPTATNLLLAGGTAIFFFIANDAYGIFEPYMSSKPLADVVNEYLQPQDELVIYGDFVDGSSLAFYTHRRAWIYNGRYNNLEYGSYYRDAPQIFLNDRSFRTFWNAHHRVFLFIPLGLHDQALKHLSENPAWRLTESGGKEIYTNQLITSSEASLAQVIYRHGESGTGSLGQKRCSDCKEAAH